MSWFTTLHAQYEHRAETFRLFFWLNAACAVVTAIALIINVATIQKPEHILALIMLSFVWFVTFVVETNRILAPVRIHSRS